MKERKARIILDIWIARAGSVFGWICLVFWAMIGIVGLTELPKAKSGVEYSAPFICLGLAALHWLMIRAAKDTRKLVGTFRLYSSVFAGGTTGIDNLAETLKVPEDQVMHNLQRMCRRGYFRGHIDYQKRSMEFDPAGDRYVARCPGCGAATAIFRTGDACRYCGAPLVRKTEE